MEKRRTKLKDNSPTQLSIQHKDLEFCDYSIDGDSNRDDSESEIESNDDDMERKTDNDESNTEDKNENNQQNMEIDRHSDEEEFSFLNEIPYDDDLFSEPEERPEKRKEKIFDDKDFKKLFLRRDLMDGITSCGYKEMSDVQAKCLPETLKGRNSIIAGPPGCGKTTLALITILQSIPKRPSRSRKIEVIIVCHCRELVLMTIEKIQKLSKNMGNVRLAALAGGVSQRRVIMMLHRSRPNIVVGTPKKLASIGSLSSVVRAALKNVKHFVIENLDYFLDHHHMHSTISWLHSLASPNKQTIITTKLVPTASHRDSYRKLTTDPFEFYAEKREMLPKTLRQYILTVDGTSYADEDCPMCQSKHEMMPIALATVLDGIYFTQAIIFVDTTEECKKLTEFFQKHNFPFVHITSDVLSKTREQAFLDFRATTNKILITTDALSHVTISPYVSLVISYNINSHATSNHDLFLRHSLAVPDCFSKADGIALLITDGANDEARKRIGSYQAEFNCVVEELPSQLNKLEMPEQQIERYKYVHQMKKKEEAEKSEKKRLEEERRAERIRYRRYGKDDPLVDDGIKSDVGDSDSEVDESASGDDDRSSDGSEDCDIATDDSSDDGSDDEETQDNVYVASKTSTDEETQYNVSVASKTSTEFSRKYRAETKPHPTEVTLQKKPDFISRRSKSTLLENSTMSEKEIELKLKTVSKVLLQRHLKVVSEPPPSHACMIL